MRTETFDGRCTCGHIRYRLLSRPLFVHCCHCYWCQRETGSAFVLNALIENSRVELLAGEPVMIDTPTRSGKGQRITRCPHCHVALWSHYLAGSKSISFVRVGTLEQPQLLPPDIHIYTASKQPWVNLPPDVPAKSGYYVTSQYWPADSLTRREALRKTKTKATAE